MSDVGRPSQLEDKSFLLKIRELVLDGKTEVEIQQILDVPKGTWNYWKYTNYHNFSDIMLSYTQERKLQKAESKIESLIESEDDRVALQASTFVAETLGKDKGYSKRTEMTGKNGEKILVMPVELINKNATDNSAE